MVVNTHVWLVLNIFAKSQTCVEKTIVFSPNIPTLFFEGNKDFVIRSCSQFKTESSSLVILLGVTSSSLKLKDGSLPLKICYLWLNSFRPFWLDSTKKACDFIDKSRKAIFFHSGYSSTTGRIYPPAWVQPENIIWTPIIGVIYKNWWLFIGGRKMIKFKIKVFICYSQ